MHTSTYIQPTRITDHTTTLIVTVFTLIPFDYDCVSGNLITDISDHLPNFLIFNKFKKKLKKHLRFIVGTIPI